MSLFGSLDEQMPARFDLQNDEHLKQLYEIFRHAANRQKEELREYPRMHPDDAFTARGSFKAYDAAARAINKLRKTVPNVELRGASDDA